MKPLVSIVIPNYNGRELIEKCLKAVLKTDYPNFEVLLVDDASTDGSVEFVKALFGSDPRLRILRNSLNIGAAATRNVGIGASRGQIIAFLDNDTEIEPGWLKELVEVLDSNEKIGAAQSKILLLDGHLACVGELIIPYIGWVILKGSGKKDDGSYDRIDDICASSGAMAVNRKVAKKAGLFDPMLAFLQFEDLDFSWRIWLTGHRVVFAPRSVVYHDARVKHKKSGPIQSLRRHILIQYVSQRNCIRVLMKNYDNSNLLKYLPLSILAMFFRALYGLYRNKDAYPMIGLLKGILWNIAHLGDTLRERKRVQRLVRKVPDSYLMKRIMIKLPPLYVFREFLSKGHGF